MKSLILMIQFMTRFPIPLSVEFTADHFVQGMKWMPLVGLLAALPGALVFALADTWLSRDVAALFSVIMLITVTGGLHLDGIADTADGLFSYRSRERMLEIMRDSTLGTNGVIALSLTILLKVTLLADTPGQGALFAVLATPVLGRTALTWHSASARYAREVRGIGDYVNQMGITQALAASALSFGITLLLLALFGVRGAIIPAVAMLLLLPSIALATGFALYLKKRLGGITGDTIGASIELSEMLSYLVILLVWKYLL
nr:adenosylcobinamide-GDP ribazoletransferase [uncultured Desulfobulbus sp.]